MAKFIAAAIQMASTGDIQENLQQAGALLEEAAKQGAVLAALPEYLHRLGRRSAECAEEVPGGETFCFLAQKAKELNLWILGGSVMEKNPDGLPFNTSMLIAPDGTLAAKYRKAHLFDVDIPGGVSVQESARMAKGEKPVFVEIME